MGGDNRGQHIISINLVVQVPVDQFAVVAGQFNVFQQGFQFLALPDWSRGQIFEVVVLLRLNQKSSGDGEGFVGNVKMRRDQVNGGFRQGPGCEQNGEPAKNDFTTAQAGFFG